MLSIVSSSIVLVILSFLAQAPAEAFVIGPSLSSRSMAASSTTTSLFSSTKDGETEVEKLLRMARELRQQAEQDEQEIHNSLHAKKEQKDSETDALIATLFDGSTPIMKKLSERKCCTETLLRIVDRLFERECKARGLEQVVSSHHHDQNTLQFKRVKTGQINQADLDATTVMMDDLLDACAQLDDKFKKDQEARGEVHVTHLDREHWNAGELANLVDSHIRGLRREHDEQFQKRQQEFFEAQRRKDLPKDGKDGEFMNRKLR